MSADERRLFCSGVGKSQSSLLLPLGCCDLFIPSAPNQVSWHYNGFSPEHPLDNPHNCLGCLTCSPLAAQREPKLTPPSSAPCLLSCTAWAAFTMPGASLFSLVDVSMKLSRDLKSECYAWCNSAVLYLVSLSFPAPWTSIVWINLPRHLWFAKLSCCEFGYWKLKLLPFL